MKALTKHSRQAFEVSKTLQEAGFLAYFAGGCVRDFLMEKIPEDFDIATTATPDQIEKIFPKTIAVGKQFGVMIVVINGEQYEVATFRKDGSYADGRHPSHVEFVAPEQDALRRDFTVNGLFYDPSRDKVIDYVRGERDIRNKIIRAIGDPEQRFEEDKLRLLRAIRFACTLEFEIEPETWQSIQRNAQKIHVVSPERIRDEVVKILIRPGAARGFRLLHESGLLKEILPEIEQMIGVGQSPEHHPEGDVFVHTMLLLEKLRQPSKELALGALFHDVGKPGTYGVKEDGKITFYEHEHLGARMTEDILKRLRFSNQEIDIVVSCVQNHMKFGHVQQMRSGKLKQFMSRDHFDTELELHRIDCLSSHGKLDNYEFLKKKKIEFAEENLRPKAILNGNDLIQLGLKPGPAMKIILSESYDKQMEGEIKTRSEALDFARLKIAELKQTNSGQ